MYSGSDDTRFVRKRAGRGEFEFSDVGGKFIVIARMDDAGATFKPVLHLGLTPVDEQGQISKCCRNLDKISVTLMSTLLSYLKLNGYL